MARLTITLTPEEKAALASYARQHRRDPRDQAAIELQQLLKRAGYLPIDGGAPAGLALDALASELAPCYS